MKSPVTLLANLRASATVKAHSNSYSHTMEILVISAALFIDHILTTDITAESSQLWVTAVLQRAYVSSSISLYKHVMIRVCQYFVTFLFATCYRPFQPYNTVISLCSTV
jgi:hypothetical protein